MDLDSGIRLLEGATWCFLDHCNIRSILTVIYELDQKGHIGKARV